MIMGNDKDFVAPERIQVIIPYSDLEKMVKVVQEVDEIKLQYKQLQAQYAAIQLMFSECLEKIQDLTNFVKD